jgi:hypothetical protein
MSLLTLAVEKRRWDLAAHTIVLAAARHLNNGAKRDGRAGKEKTRRAKR